MHRLYGRRKPYSDVGIRRLPCYRCGKPSRFQWNVCADGGLYHPLCFECDVELNRMVLTWMNHPNAENVAQGYAELVARGG